MRWIALTGLGVAAGAVIILLARVMSERPGDAPLDAGRSIRTTIPWGTPIIGQA